MDWIDKRIEPKNMNASTVVLNSGNNQVD